CGGVGVLQLLGANDARFAERIELLQPVLVAYQTGLTAVLRDLGVSADAVIGHSVGEVSAAHAAGIIDVAAAARVVAARSALLGELAGTGGMLATELSREQAQAMCSEFTLDVSVAVHNGPRSTVLSGTDAALIAMASRLTSDGIFCRRVRVDVPAHSAKLEGLMPRLRERLGRLDLRTSQMGFYSTVTGGLLESHRLTADYWVQNLRAPVEFKAAVDAVMNGEHGSDVCFVEVSAHPALLAAVQDCVGAERRVRVLPTFRRDDESAEQLLRTLSDIYAFGVDVEWRNLVPRKYGALALPPYPFFNERHWLEPPALKATGPESSSTSELRWRECSLDPSAVSAQIGRASCRERVEHAVG